MNKLVISVVLLNLLAACAVSSPRLCSCLLRLHSPLHCCASFGLPHPPAPAEVDPLNDPPASCPTAACYPLMDVVQIRQATVQAHAKH